MYLCICFLKTRKILNEFVIILEGIKEIVKESFKINIFWDPTKKLALTILTADSDCDKLLKDGGLPMKKNDCHKFVGVNRRKNIYIIQCMTNKTVYCNQKKSILYLLKITITF